ncbi:MAG: septum formation initiator family protein [Acidimicrobiales bacterium]
MTVVDSMKLFSRQAGPQTMSTPSLSFAMNVLRGWHLPLMLALVLFAGLVYFIFPTTTWLDQRAEASEVQEELDALVGEQAELRQEIARMRTDDEVELIARRDFNFVLPGEEAYAILPAQRAPVSLPSSWPFNLLYSEVLD